MSSVAPKLIALHGFTGCGHDFKLLQSLSPDWNWLTPDMPGHGVQASLGCSWDAVVSLVNEVMEEDSCLEKPALLGYSMGGRFALHYAVENQDKLAALILISATAGIRLDQERSVRKEADRQLASHIEDIGVQAFEDEWRKKPIIQSQENIDPEWRERLFAERQNTSKGLADSLRGLGTGTMLPLWDELSGLGIPVLLLCGAEDSKFVGIAREMDSLLQSSELVIVDEVGHAAHLENPVFVHKKIEHFLGSIYS